MMSAMSGRDTLDGGAGDRKDLENHDITKLDDL